MVPFEGGGLVERRMRRCTCSTPQFCAPKPCSTSAQYFNDDVGWLHGSSPPRPAQGTRRTRQRHGRRRGHRPHALGRVAAAQGARARGRHAAHRAQRSRARADERRARPRPQCGGRRDRPRTRLSAVGRVPQPPERRGHAAHLPHGRGDAAAERAAATSPRSPGSSSAAPTSTPSSPSSPTSPPTTTSSSRTPCPACCRGAGAACKAVPLLTEPLDIGLPADHRLAGRAHVTPADLVDETWLGVPPGFPFERILHAIEQEGGKRVQVSQRFSDMRIVEAFIEAGLGIAFVPQVHLRHGLVGHRAEADPRRRVGAADRRPGAAGCRGAPRRAHRARRARGPRRPPRAGLRASVARRRRDRARGVRELDSSVMSMPPAKTRSCSTCVTGSPTSRSTVRPG